MNEFIYLGAIVDKEGEETKILRAGLRRQEEHSTDSAEF